MKKIFLYEPGISSNNIGDQIIVASIKSEFKSIFDNSFLMEFATHTPISNRYMFFLGKPDWKFILGSNILVGKLNSVIHLKQWMLSCVTFSNIYNSIFIGVSVQQYNQQFNLYTKFAYRNFFNPNYIHSVRDTYTESALKKIDIRNIINTGCPTMWRLNENHCKQIPINKAKNVIFTLTDYKPNLKRDEHIIDVLKRNYSSLFFWSQGFGDYEYFEKLKNTSGINLINPNLEAFDNFLTNTDVDFVGTRLHGGIRALQKFKRTLIIGVDNRAIEMHKDFNLPVLNETEINLLEKTINNEIITDIKIPVENISLFLKQFDIKYI